MCPLNDHCSCHEDDEAERQSDTACCPRQTIPDSCSCLGGLRVHVPGLHLRGMG